MKTTVILAFVLTATVQGQKLKEEYGPDILVQRLRSHGGRPAELVAYLEHRHPDIRRASAGAFSRLKGKAKEAVPALILLLKKRDPETRRLSLIALGGIGADGETAKDGVTAALKDPDADVRKYACSTLAVVAADDPATVPSLLEMMKDDDKSDAAIHCSVRHYAVRALGELGPKAAPAVPALIVSLKDGEVGMRCLSLFALRRIQPRCEAARAEFVILLDDVDPCTRWSAAAALVSIGAPAKDDLLRAINNKCAVVKKTAARGLVELGVELRIAAFVLAEVLEEKESWLFDVSAIRTLGTIGPDADVALPVLRKLLDGKDEDVRKAAAEAIEKITRAGPRH